MRLEYILCVLFFQLLNYSNQEELETVPHTEASENKTESETSISKNSSFPSNYSSRSIPKNSSNLYPNDLSGRYDKPPRVDPSKYAKLVDQWYQNYRSEEHASKESFFNPRIHKLPDYEVDQIISFPPRPDRVRSGSGPVREHHHHHFYVPKKKKKQGHSPETGHHHQNSPPAYPLTENHAPGAPFYDPNFGNPEAENQFRGNIPDENLRSGYNPYSLTPHATHLAHQPHPFFTGYGFPQQHISGHIDFHYPVDESSNTGLTSGYIRDNTQVHQHQQPQSLQPHQLIRQHQTPQQQLTQTVQQPLYQNPQQQQQTYVSPQIQPVQQVLTQPQQVLTQPQQVIHSHHTQPVVSSGSFRSDLPLNDYQTHSHQFAHNQHYPVQTSGSYNSQQPYNSHQQQPAYQNSLQPPVRSGYQYGNQGHSYQQPLHNSYRSEQNPALQYLNYINQIDRMLSQFKFNLGYLGKLFQSCNCSESSFNFTSISPFVYHGLYGRINLNGSNITQSNGNNTNFEFNEKIVDLGELLEISTKNLLENSTAETNSSAEFNDSTETLPIFNSSDTFQSSDNMSVASVNDSFSIHNFTVSGGNETLPYNKTLQNTLKGRTTYLLDSLTQLNSQLGPFLGQHASPLGTNYLTASLPSAYESDQASFYASQISQLGSKLSTALINLISINGPLCDCDGTEIQALPTYFSNFGFPLQTGYNWLGNIFGNQYGLGTGNSLYNYPLGGLTRTQGVGDLSNSFRSGISSINQLMANNLPSATGGTLFGGSVPNLGLNNIGGVGYPASNPLLGSLGLSPSVNPSITSPLGFSLSPQLDSSGVSSLGGTELESLLGLAGLGSPLATGFSGKNRGEFEQTGIDNMTETSFNLDDLMKNEHLEMNQLWAGLKKRNFYRNSTSQATLEGSNSTIRSETENMQQRQSEREEDQQKKAGQLGFLENKNQPPYKNIIMSKTNHSGITQEENLLPVSYDLTSLFKSRLKLDNIHENPQKPTLPQKQKLVFTPFSRPVDFNNNSVFRKRTMASEIDNQDVFKNQPVYQNRRKINPMNQRTSTKRSQLLQNINNFKKRNAGKNVPGVSESLITPGFQINDGFADVLKDIEKFKTKTHNVRQRYQASLASLANLRTRYPFYTRRPSPSPYRLQQRNPQANLLNLVPMPAKPEKNRQRNKFYFRPKRVRPSVLKKRAKTSKTKNTTSKERTDNSAEKPKAPVSITEQVEKVSKDTEQKISDTDEKIIIHKTENTVNQKETTPGPESEKAVPNVKEPIKKAYPESSEKTDLEEYLNTEQLFSDIDNLPIENSENIVPVYKDPVQITDKISSNSSSLKENYKSGDEYSHQASTHSQNAELINRILFSNIEAQPDQTFDLKESTLHKRHISGESMKEKNQLTPVKVKEEFYSEAETLNNQKDKISYQASTSSQNAEPINRFLFSNIETQPDQRSDLKESTLYKHHISDESVKEQHQLTPVNEEFYSAAGTPNKHSDEIFDFEKLQSKSGANYDYDYLISFLEDYGRTGLDSDEIIEDKPKITIHQVQAEDKLQELLKQQSSLSTNQEESKLPESKQNPKEKPILNFFKNLFNHKFF